MKVSICIPVYNVEKHIKRCLESIVCQTHKDLEIIVVNDNTPDGSMDIVNEFANRDGRIRIINHEKNNGLMMARRTAYMAAKGEYITFCDSDDSIPNDAIEVLLNAALNSNADIVGGNYTYIDVNNHHTIILSNLRYGNDKLSIYKSLLKKEMVHNLWAKLFKRPLLQDYEYKTFQNFTNAEDACLFYQVVDNTKKMVWIDRSVYFYYQNLDSSTHVRLSPKALGSIAQAINIKVNISERDKKIDKMKNTINELKKKMNF